jgi:hypothetical protein
MFAILLVAVILVAVAALALFAGWAPPACPNHASRRQCYDYEDQPPFEVYH